MNSDFAPWLWCLASLLFMAGWGYVVACLLMKDDQFSRMELFGISACLGPGVTGLACVFLSMLGFPPTRALMLTMAGILVFVLAVLRTLGWFNKTVPVVPVKASSNDWVWLAIPLLALGYGIAMISRESLFQPVWDWDAYSIWQLKTKVLLHQPLVPRSAYFSDVTLSFSHLRYPVLMPMMSAMTDAFIGRFDDHLTKASSLLLYIGLASLICGYLRRAAGSLPALYATAMLMAAPAMLNCAGLGTAEIALTAFWGASVIFLLRWIQSNQLQDIVASAIFTALATWTKNEGTAIAAVNAIAMLVWVVRSFSLRRLTGAVTFIAIVGLLYAPWIIYARNIPRTDEDYAGKLHLSFILHSIPRLKTIVPAIARELLHFKQWGLLWVLPVVFSVSGFRNGWKWPIPILWLLLIFHLWSYVFAYMISPWNFNELIWLTSARLLMHAAPAAALLIGLGWPRAAAPGHLPEAVPSIAREREIIPHLA